MEKLDTNALILYIISRYNGTATISIRNDVDFIYANISGSSLKYLVNSGIPSNLIRNKKGINIIKDTMNI
ncbi:MAG: hypothetical protein Q4G18_05390 [Myroides sp.]|nr:hypothetical protein [Myroides sp.]